MHELMNFYRFGALGQQLSPERLNGNTDNTIAVAQEQPNFSKNQSHNCSSALPKKVPFRATETTGSSHVYV